jgi:hypothetical protein
LDKYTFFLKIEIEKKEGRRNAFLVLFFCCCFFGLTQSREAFEIPINTQ